MLENMSEGIDFSGQTLLITGASGTICREVATLYLALGGNVVLTDLDETAVTALAAALDPTGTRVLAIRHDVTDPAHAEAAFSAAAQRFGGVDHLVTGAGLYRDRTIAAMSDAEWKQSIGINLDGVFYTCRAAIPHLRAGGAIVNIASMAGHRGSHTHGHYAAAKGGVLTLTRTLALELAPKIRVNAISPGLIDGPMVQPLLAARGPQLMAQTPLGRLGTPLEVARAITFLCSGWASFITGEALHVNGGLFMD
jgi:3-oxoacyl-[acyl-carrier protein] reductase